MELGIDDPEAWLDSVPDRVLRVWEAYWRVEPWGVEWERHSRMMVLLDAIYAATVNPNLPKHKRHDIRSEDSFMPVDYLRDKPKRSGSIYDQMMVYAKRVTRGHND